MRIAIFLLTFLPAGLAAQDSTGTPDSAAALQNGARIRVWSPGSISGDSSLVPRIGIFKGTDRGELLLQRFGTVEPKRIPPSQVSKLEISDGGTPPGRGAMRGALIGAAFVGGLVALMHSEGSEGGQLGAGYVFTFGMPLGAATGAMIGFMTASGERWRRVPWPRQDPAGS